MAASLGGFLMCAQVLMHAIAHGGCTDTVGESALRADLAFMLLNVHGGEMAY